MESTSYAPFGEIITGGNISRYDYEAQEYDSVVGDYDFNFRKYRADLGIFTQPDSLIQNVYDPQLLNRYAFERNNPYKYTDPTGHIVIYVGGLGMTGFGTGVTGSTGFVMSFSFSDGFQFGRYERPGYGAITPTLSGSIEIGISPFQKNLAEFRGSTKDIGGDIGEMASIGLGISIPYEEDEKGKKEYKWSKFIIEGTGTVLDLNPPILPISLYGVQSNTQVHSFRSDIPSKSWSLSKRLEWYEKNKKGTSKSADPEAFYERLRRTKER